MQGPSQRLVAPARVVVLAAGWIAALFGFMRIPWVQESLLLPLAKAQGGLACRLAGTPVDSVRVDLSCTGSDAMALCVGAILAFPALWKRRLLGAALGISLILVLNTARIGTLSVVVGRSELFNFLHVYLWPAALIVAAAGFVFYWVGNSALIGDAARRLERPATDPRGSGAVRFLVLLVVFVALFYAGSRWLFTSDAVLAVAQWSAAAAAFVMSSLGVSAEVTGHILRTSYGRWGVTQECIATPLIPVYLAAALALSGSALQRVLRVAAALPLFALLGTARLLVLALPPAVVGSHDVAIHSFYQVLAALLAIGLTAFAARPGAATGFGPPLARAGRGLAFGALAAIVVGALTRRLWPLAAAVPERIHLGHGFDDAQGALSLMPAFQVGLMLALWASLGRRLLDRRLAVALGVLVAGQAAFAVLAGEGSAHLGVELPIAAIRAYALAVPILGAWALHQASRSSAFALPGGPGSAPEPREWGGGTRVGEPAYLGFWNDVGRDFPDLGGAESTAFYREDEKRLFRDYLSGPPGRRVFKTDLWDEAKNTRILRWAARRGVRPYGIDISLPIVLEARKSLAEAGAELGGVVADVRAIPFKEGTFDAVYSMGTVEHFDETEHAVHEIFQVVRPGGRAIVGVPNRYDPFLRPLMVAVLYRLGLYGYGYEKSYSPKGLRGMLGRSGFDVTEMTGILFVPGWLRMLDLALHTWARPLARLSGLFVRPFAFLSRRFAAVRRHGYLIAAVADRPESGASSAGA